MHNKRLIEKQKKELIKFLSETMNSLGINQPKLSELTGIDQANLSRILSGKSIPTIDTFLKMCQALEIKVSLENKAEEPESAEMEFLKNLSGFGI